MMMVMMMMMMMMMMRNAFQHFQHSMYGITRCISALQFQGPYTNVLDQHIMSQLPTGRLATEFLHGGMLHLQRNTSLTLPPRQWVELLFLDARPVHPYDPAWAEAPSICHFKEFIKAHEDLTGDNFSAYQVSWPSNPAESFILALLARKHGCAPAQAERRIDVLKQTLWRNTLFVNLSVASLRTTRLCILPTSILT